MADGKVVIESKIDTSGAKKDMQTLEKDIKSSFDSASKSAESSVNKISSSTSKISESSGKSSQQAQKSISDNFDKASESVGKSTDQIKKNTQKIPDGIEPSNKKIKESFSKTFADVAKESGKSVDEIKKKVEQEAQVYMKHGDSIQTAYKKAFSNAGVTAETELNKMTQEAEKSSGRISKAFSSFKSVAITGAVAAITTGLTASVKVGSEFEAQMSRVKAISGATNSEFEKLNDLAIQLGAETSFSATEAAQGMENLAAAGFTTTEIMDAMPGLLDLAAASGEDLATSSDIAAATLRGFGLEASEAGHVADVLAEAANRTNTSVSETGEAMKYIAPVANAMGLSLEEVAAAIGIMANAGIQGSQAGTTLRGALTRLSNPTDEMKQAMSELGVSFYDSQGKMKPLAQQIELLKNATKGMTDEQKNQYLATLYGTESLSGMLALINAGPGELNSLTQAFQQSSGAAKQTADTMKDNLQGSFEGLTGSLETLGIRVFEKLSAPLQGATEIATNAVNAITSAFESGGLSGAILKIGDLALQGLESFANNFQAAAPTLISKGFELLNNLANGIIQALPTLIEKVPQIVTTIANTISTSMPIILLKGAELILKLIAGIIQAIPTLIANIPAIINAIVSVFLAYNWLSLGSSIIKSLGSGIKAMVGFVKSSGTSIFNAIKSAIANLPATLLNLGKNAVNFFGNAIRSGSGLAKTAAKAIFNAVKGAITSLPSVLKSLGSKAISFLGSAIRGGISAAKSAAKSVINGLKSIFKPNALTSVGKNLIKGLWAGISSVKDWVLSKIKGFGKGILDGLKSFFKIKSPSRLMRDEVGQWIAKGIAVGFDKYNPMMQITKTLSVGMHGMEQSLFAGAGNTHNQTNNFYGVQTPDQIARALRMQQIYGLAGAR